MHRLAIAAVAVLALLGLPSFFAPPGTNHAPTASAGPQAAVAIKAVTRYAETQTQPANVKPIGQQPQPQPKPAAPPTLTMPDEVHVAPGTLSQILIQTDAGAVLHYKWVGPKGASVFREYEPDPTKVAYQVLGSKPGTFYLVVTAVKDGVAIMASCTIIIDGPAPTPGPGPTPPPVPPADPLVGQLQTLYTTDTASAAEKSPVKAALAGLYSGMASQLTAGQFATVADASAALTAQAAALPLGTYLLPLRRACAAEVSNAVGPAPAAKLDPALRAKLVSTFGRLAAALNAVQ